ncbi:MAG: citrate transporter [Spirochaetia bacterium]|nr:citrate transporter [Spirochaetia bacterium]
MYLKTSIVLAAMVVSFALSSWKLKSPEISMVITAIVGALVAGLGLPVRILVEGLFTNFDLAILFVCASVFINIYSYSGSINIMTRKLVQRVDNKWVLLICMAIFMLIPGALTGAGSVSVFVVGGLVATVVRYMGLSDKKTAAFVFIFAILSAAAPPINIWTMMMTAQANMPYVGFEKLLLIPILIVGAFTIIYLGHGTKPESKEKILAELPEAVSDMGWFRILCPLVVLIALILLSLYAPFSIPVLGLPLMFVIATIVAVLCNPKKASFKDYYGVITGTIEQVFPLVATVISVGVLINVMAATGVRGLLSITFITLPKILIFLTVLLFCPFAQGCLSYGSAIIFGTPLIFMFNAAGMDTTVICAALSLIFPIGDCLPPSRIVGRVSIETVGYKGSYMSFLKQILLPLLVLGGLALIMLIIPNKLSFLK